MALFRALSSRRSQRGGGYDRLLDETHGINDASVFDANHQQQQQHHHDAVLKRVTSVPASMLFGSSSSSSSSSKKPDFETGHHLPGKTKQPAKGKKCGKSVHPVFSLFEGRWRKKKMTANPDFSRYIEYLKEGGMWNKDSNSPVIYYK